MFRNFSCTASLRSWRSWCWSASTIALTAGSIVIVRFHSNCSSRPPSATIPAGQAAVGIRTRMDVLCWQLVSRDWRRVMTSPSRTLAWSTLKAQLRSGGISSHEAGPSSAGVIGVNQRKFQIAIIAEVVLQSCSAEVTRAHTENLTSIAISARRRTWLMVMLTLGIVFRVDLTCAPHASMRDPDISSLQLSVCTRICVCRGPGIVNWETHPPRPARDRYGPLDTSRLLARLSMTHDTSDVAEYFNRGWHSSLTDTPRILKCLGGS